MQKVRHPASLQLGQTIELRGVAFATVRAAKAFVVRTLPRDEVAGAPDGRIPEHRSAGSPCWG